MRKAEGKTICIGKVSSIDYPNGMISITYPDMDDSVTDSLPYLSFNDEYKMPEIGQDVLVLHLSNGCAAGLCLGPYWNEDHPPPNGGEDIFRKEMDHTFGMAYLRFDGTEVELKGPELRFRNNAGTKTFTEILELFRRVERLEGFH